MRGKLNRPFRMEIRRKLEVGRHWEEIRQEEKDDGE